MNVEKLQRMNELARELKEHGLANSMDDAYTQADSIVGQGAYIQVRSVAPERAPQALSLVEERQAQNHIVELKEKLDGQNSKIEQMNSVMMKMQEVMNDMISEMLKLKEQRAIQNTVVEVESKPIAPAAEAPLLREIPKAIEPAQAPGHSSRGMYAEKSDANHHPRQGQYKPDDVSIEKFFHVSNMKRL